MSSNIALITGITGQDGSYLAELLLAKGYYVHGLCQSGVSRSLIHPVLDRLSLHEANIEDAQAVSALIQTIQPDECYHLAAQTFVAIRPEEESAMLDTNTVGVHRLFAAVRNHKPSCRVFLAGSAEMFGAVTESPQNEATVMKPRSFYGVTKTAAYHLLRHFRHAHTIHACCGILYNHESPRRGPNFVTRKITRTAALIKKGEARELRLGNLDAVRDWGHAADYVRAMWMMLQQDDPDDYVIATGQPRTVRDFVERAFSYAGLEWSHYVVVDPEFYRPAEPCPMVGDAAKARERLNWQPEISFDTLVAEMMDRDLAEAIAPSQPPQTMQPEIPAEFDEFTYLELNPDVEAAVLGGAFSSGHDHWVKHGQQEGRIAVKPVTPPEAPKEWREGSYLRANADVAAAVRNGTFRSGYDHWVACGAEEARPGGLATHTKADPREVLRNVPAGFNCFGYGLAPTGLGSAIRSYVDVFQSLTSNVQKVGVPLWGAEPPPEAGFDEGRLPYAFNIILQNPDVLPLFLYHYSRQTLNDRINIGSWVWELHSGYPAWHRLSRLFHEIWVPSHYVAGSLQTISAVPLFVIPYPVDGLPEAPVITRADLGLPENAFTFLYIFDLASTTGRKNPVALLRAFRNAFRDRDDVCLVLKYHNLTSDAAGAAHLERLASGCSNVRIYNQTMPHEQVHSLVQLADCFVSPHRSEGFGFNIAAAMYYGKPVIATGYSGNMDYMNARTGFLIDYDLVPVGSGHAHYRENYAWAEPSPEHLESLLLHVFENQESAREIGLAGKTVIRSEYSVTAIAQKVEARVRALSKGEPTVAEEADPI